MRDIYDELLPWATWPWQRCRARPQSGVAILQDAYGLDSKRCELKRKHTGRHAVQDDTGVLTWS